MRSYVYRIASIAALVAGSPDSDKYSDADVLKFEARLRRASARRGDQVKTLAQVVHKSGQRARARQTHPGKRGRS